MTLNWQDARARLERMRQVLAGEGAPDPEAAAEILKRRAQALARPLAAEQAVQRTAHLLIFDRSGERYGLAVGEAAAVALCPPVTPVPGAPAAVAGVVPHRGRALALVDLPRLLGRRGPDSGGGRWIVVVQSPAYALLADAVSGVEAAEPGQAPPAAPNGRPGVVRAVTPDMVKVLDPAAVLEAAGRQGGRNG